MNMSKTFIPDSNIFAKLLFEETDSKLASEFFEQCIHQDAKLIVPELFTYEIMSICQYYGGNISKALSMIEAYKDVNLTVISPNINMWKKAANIANDGNPKSGFPSMYDSIYHALAIELDGIFVTADKKHFTKAAQYKNICILSEWQGLF